MTTPTGTQNLPAATLPAATLGIAQLSMGKSESTEDARTLRIRELQAIVAQHEKEKEIQRSLVAELSKNKDAEITVLKRAVDDLRNNIQDLRDANADLRGRNVDTQINQLREENATLKRENDAFKHAGASKDETIRRLLEENGTLKEENGALKDSVRVAKADISIRAKNQSILKDSLNRHNSQFGHNTSNRDNGGAATMKGEYISEDADEAKAIKDAKQDGDLHLYDACSAAPTVDDMTNEDIISIIAASDSPATPEQLQIVIKLRKFSQLLAIQDNKILVEKINELRRFELRIPKRLLPLGSCFDKNLITLAEVLWPRREIPVGYIKNPILYAGHIERVRAMNRAMDSIR